MAGLLNGLVALGGGIIVTPMLVASGRASPMVAVGTSLTVVVVLSSVSFLVHSAFATLQVGILEIAVSIAGGTIGGFLGSRLLARLTARWMLFGFSAFVLLVATKLVAQGLGHSLPGGAVDGTAPLTAYAGFGLFAGTLSGVFGVGGGALVLLGLAAFYGVPVQAGLPLALALNVTNALAGAIRHARAGQVLWGEVRVLIPTALIGIVLGTVLAWWLPPDPGRVVFGAFFAIMGVRIARQGARMS